MSQRSSWPVICDLPVCGGVTRLFFFQTQLRIHFPGSNATNHRLESLDTHTHTQIKRYTQIANMEQLLIVRRRKGNYSSIPFVSVQTETRSSRGHFFFLITAYYVCLFKKNKKQKWSNTSRGGLLPCQGRKIICSKLKSRWRDWDVRV